MSDSDSNSDPPLPPTNPRYCTFAVTGARKTYQAIFVCRTCCSPQALTCVCEACANHCHAHGGHDDEEPDYLGMAMAYCDCCAMGACRIIEASQQHASECLIVCIDSRPLQPLDHTISRDRLLADVYAIPELYQNAAACAALVEEALLLVQHSKETFWLAGQAQHSPTTTCLLEKMALRIVEQTVALYQLQMNEAGGAEWWVQVKKNVSEAPPLGYEAVDLHYDKDEELAEKYGLGAFPTLSTVTYLTQGEATNPTVIFGRTYEQPDDDVISEMVIQHPVWGKHVVFDGRLLHGAPRNAELLQTHIVAAAATTDLEVSPPQDNVRVTFLVNIWTDQKPFAVNPLSSTIRASLCSLRSENNGIDQPFPSSEETTLAFQKQDMKEVVLQEEEGKQITMDRIELPFVCKGITWESEDDESAGLVLVTYPPPRTEEDSVHVRFGPGLQAYLDQAYTEDRVPDYNPRIGMTDMGYEEAYI